MINLIPTAKYSRTTIISKLILLALLLSTLTSCSVTREGIIVGVEMQKDYLQSKTRTVYQEAI